MTLKRCREQWERWYGESKVVLEVVDSTGAYQTIIVVVKFVSENPHYVTYNTLRYFANYSTPECSWVCSKDYEGNDLEDALKEVMDHFRDNYSDLLLTS